MNKKEITDNVLFDLCEFINRYRTEFYEKENIENELICLIYKLEKHLKMIEETKWIEKNMRKY